MNIFVICVFILTFSCLPGVLKDSYAHGITNPWVHQRIAKQALKVWKNCPQEIKDHAQKDIDSPMNGKCKARFDAGDDIIIGSAEEDREIDPIECWVENPYGEEFCTDRNEGRNGFFEHFWDPDYPNVAGYNCSSTKVQDGAYNKGFDTDVPLVPLPGDGHWDSAYRLAKTYWKDKVIDPYKEGKRLIRNGNDQAGKAKIDEAYYWLGRVAHLLTDLTVPAHIHGLPHDDWIIDFGGGDWFEGYFDKDHPEKITRYKGTKVQGGPYLFEKLPNLSGFNWQEVHPNPTNLFKLFWYTAQKTQYFASKSKEKPDTFFRDGNKFYIRYKPIDNKTKVYFITSLWANENYYGSQVPIKPISKVGDIPTDNPGLQRKMADALIPHAIRTVAGLYRLFWYETRDYFEDFDDGLSQGWTSDHPEDWQVKSDIIDGEVYRAYCPSPPKQISMVSTYGGGIYRDFEYQVDIKQRKVGSYASYMIFRATADFNCDFGPFPNAIGSGYAFGIAGEWPDHPYRYFYVYKLNNGTWKSISNNWIPSNYIKPTTEWNSLKVIVNGDLFKLYINDNLVYQFTDNTIYNGRIGLIGYTKLDNNSTHDFDRVSVTKY